MACSRERGREDDEDEDEDDYLGKSGRRNSSAVGQVA
jgi:hypothetical protein